MLRTAKSEAIVVQRSAPAPTPESSCAASRMKTVRWSSRNVVLPELSCLAFETMCGLRRQNPTFSGLSEKNHNAKVQTLLRPQEIDQIIKLTRARKKKR